MTSPVNSSPQQERAGLDHNADREPPSSVNNGHEDDKSNNNNNNNNASSSSHRQPDPLDNSNRVRKRRRLNAVLDKLTSHLHNNSQNLKNNNAKLKLNSRKSSKMYGRTGSSSSSSSQSSANRGPPAAIRREQWRDNQQQSVDVADQPASTTSSSRSGEVFKFDSFDRDRYIYSGAMGASGVTVAATATAAPQASAVELIRDESGSLDPETFSPVSGRSPHSSMSSPQVSVDSPRLCFSPLKIKDSIEEEEETTGIVLHNLPRLNVRGCDSNFERGISPRPHGDASTSIGLHPQQQSNKLLPGYIGGSGSLSRPLSPNPTTPISPSPTPSSLGGLRYLPAHLTDVYRRKCMSETDLTSSWDDLSRQQGHQQQHLQQPYQQQHQMLQQRLSHQSQYHQQSHNHPRLQSSLAARSPLSPSISNKGGSLESEASSSTTTTTQESPLDLSVRSSTSITGSMDNVTIYHPLPVRGRRRSHGRSASARSASGATIDRYSLDRLDSDPPSSEAAAASSPGFVCTICGQMFSLSDRLAKHMASRHKSRSTDSGSKAYLCDVCKRSFARSDMLTRHMRLHTGVKPYTCRVCGQVFSRSDHLSTHQRTHTGEKPYRCPSCPYAACRRDMITRHMRTHSRYELQDSTGCLEATDSSPTATTTTNPSSSSAGVITSVSRSISVESNDPVSGSAGSVTKPPSPMETQSEDVEHPPE